MTAERKPWFPAVMVLWCVGSIFVYGPSLLSLVVFGVIGFAWLVILLAAVLR